MYQLIRKIHLYTAFVLLTFIVMYFVTGWALIHPAFFDSEKPEKTVHAHALDFSGTPASGEFSDYLQEEFGLNGWKAEPRRLDDGRWRFRYIHPGMAYEAVVNQRADSVVITESPENLRGILVHLHRIHRYGGGFLYDVWMIFYDLTSLAMILFAVSGILLWYQLSKKKLLGWILLFISFSFTISSILYLLYAP